MAVRSMRTTAGWDQRTREKERKGVHGMLFQSASVWIGSFVFHNVSIRLACVVFFFLSPLNSWHFSPLLCYLLIVFYFVFTVGSICLFFFAIDFFIVKWELPGSSESRRRNNKREGRTIHQTYQDYPERKRKQRREGITHIEVEHTAMLHMPLDRNCIDRRPGQLRARLYVTTRQLGREIRSERTGRERLNLKHR